MPIDYKKYPDNWREEIRPSILKRDAYKCKKCTAGQRKKGYRDKNGAFVECDDFDIEYYKKRDVKIITIYLQVAHLNHDVNDNRPENLLSMCQKCHLDFDRSHKALMRKMRK